MSLDQGSLDDERVGSLASAYLNARDARSGSANRDARTNVFSSVATPGSLMSSANGSQGSFMRSVRDMGGGGAKRRKPGSPAWALRREQGWVADAADSASSRLPSYDAVSDQHCLYTKASANFHQSPHMQGRLDARRLADALALPLPANAEEAWALAAKRDAAGRAGGGGGGGGQRRQGGRRQSGPAALPPVAVEAHAPHESPESRQLRRVAFAACRARDGLLARLAALPPTDAAAAAAACAACRAHALSCVEAIVGWRRSIGRLGAQAPFVHGGRNYLLSLADNDDCGRALSRSPATMAALAGAGAGTLAEAAVEIARNPFLLAKNIDTIGTISALAASTDEGSAADPTDLLAQAVGAAAGADDHARSRYLAACRVLLAEELLRSSARAGTDPAAMRRWASAAPPPPAPEPYADEGGDDGRPMTSSETMRLQPPLSSVSVAELRALAQEARPAAAVVVGLACATLVLNPEAELPSLAALRRAPLRRTLLRKPKALLAALAAYDPTDPLPSRVLNALWPLITNPNFNVGTVAKHSPGAAALYGWVQKVVLHQMNAPRAAQSIEQMSSTVSGRGMLFAPPSPSGMSRGSTRGRTPGASRHGNRNNPDEAPVFDLGDDGSYGSAAEMGSLFDGSSADEADDDSDTFAGGGGGGGQRNVAWASDGGQGAHVSLRMLGELQRELVTLRRELSMRGVLEREPQATDAAGAAADPRRAAVEAANRLPVMSVNVGGGNDDDASAASMADTVGAAAVAAASATTPSGGRVLLLVERVDRAAPESVSVDVQVWALLPSRRAAGAQKKGSVDAALEEASGTLSVEAWDVAGQRQLAPLAVSCVTCDRLCGASPTELSKMPPVDRRAALEPLVEVIGVDGDASPDDDRDAPPPVTLRVDAVVANGLYVVSRQRYEVAITYAMVANARAAAAPGDLTLRARPAGSTEAAEWISLDVRGYELELLLLSQPGLYGRARVKWPALRALAEWLISRLTVRAADRSNGADRDTLVLERSVALPAGAALRDVPGIAERCALEASQCGDGLDLRLSAPKGHDPDGILAGAVSLEAQRPLAILTIPLHEVRALAGAGAAPPSLSGDGRRAPAPKGALHAVLARVGIVGRAEQEAADDALSAATGASPSGGGGGGGGGGASSPSGRKSKSVWEREEKVGLRLDRVVFHEAVVVSGVPLLLTATVAGLNLLYHATRVGDDAEVLRAAHDGGGGGGSSVGGDSGLDGMVGGAEDGFSQDPSVSESQRHAAARAASASTAGDEFLKLVRPAEMAALAALRGRPAALLEPASRGALAAEVAADLKLVRSGGSDGGSGAAGADLIPGQSPLLLETVLHRTNHYLSVGVDGASKRHLIGGVDVDDQTTLHAARKLIGSQLDDADVPRRFRFEHRGGPVARAQERLRRAVECAEADAGAKSLTIVLLTGAGGERRASPRKKTPASRARGGGSSRKRHRAAAAFDDDPYHLDGSDAAASAGGSDGEGSVHSSRRKPRKRKSQKKRGRTAARADDDEAASGSGSASGSASGSGGDGDGRAGSGRPASGRKSRSVTPKRKRKAKKKGKKKRKPGPPGPKKAKRDAAFFDGLKAADGEAPNQALPEGAAPPAPPTIIAPPVQRPKTPIPMVAVPVPITVVAVQGRLEVSLSEPFYVEELDDPLNAAPGEHGGSLRGYLTGQGHGQEASLATLSLTDDGGGHSGTDDGGADFQSRPQTAEPLDPEAAAALEAQLEQEAAYAAQEARAYALDPAVKAHFTPSQLESIRRVFDTFDEDNSRTIDRDELTKAMVALDVDPEEAHAIVDEADDDGDGVVSYAEFVHLVHLGKNDTAAGAAANSGGLSNIVDRAERKAAAELAKREAGEALEKRLVKLKIPPLNGVEVAPLAQADILRIGGPEGKDWAVSHGSADGKVVYLVDAYDHTMTSAYAPPPPPTPPAGAPVAPMSMAARAAAALAKRNGGGGGGFGGAAKAAAALAGAKGGFGAPPALPGQQRRGGVLPRAAGQPGQAEAPRPSSPDASVASGLSGATSVTRKRPLPMAPGAAHAAAAPSPSYDDGASVGSHSTVSAAPALATRGAREKAAKAAAASVARVTAVAGATAHGGKRMSLAMAWGGVDEHAEAEAAAVEAAAAKRDERYHEDGGVVVGSEFLELLVWRLIPKALDTRPKWRIGFDNGTVPYEYEFQDSAAVETHFRCRVPFADLERRCCDQRVPHPTHQQRLQHFGNIAADTIIDETFEFVRSYFPVTEGVEGSKWIKFVRETRIFPDIHKPKRNAQVDLAFARRFKRGGGEKQSHRSLDVVAFKEALTEISMLRFARLSDDPDRALMHALLEYVVMVPEVNRRAWREAKRLAMLCEARRQCAATRLQALQRTLRAMFEYRVHINAAVIIAQYARRKLYLSRYQTRRRYLERDRVFRRRFASALKIQGTYRVYVARATFRRKVAAARAEYVARVEARRSRQRDRRKRREAATSFRRVKIINGVLVLVSMRRTDPSQFKDYSMEIHAYVPRSQERFVFEIQDMEVRRFLEEALNVEGLSGDEILLPENLSLLAERLVTRVVLHRPIVIFSRRSLGERGLQIARRGLMISGNVYVITVYWSPDECVFHAYDAKTSSTMRAAITVATLRKWLQEEETAERKAAELERQRLVGEAKKIVELYEMGVGIDGDKLAAAEALLAEADAARAEKAARRQAALLRQAKKIHGAGDENAVTDMGGEEKPTSAAPAAAGTDSAADEDDDEVVGTLEPSLLKEDNRPALLSWLMARLYVIKRRHGTLAGRPMLLLQNEVEADLMEQMAAVVQGMWRMRKARQRLRAMLRKTFEKRYEPGTGNYYYVNVKTGETQWTKPVNMGSDELTDPPDEWREMVDENGGTYYMNPARGTTSWMSEEQAAVAMQRMVRHHQASDFGRPTISQMIKALRMQREAEDKYSQFPNRLSSIVNWALVLHTQKHELETAKPLYKSAMETSAENPVLLRAYALFVLASLEPPRAVMYKRALDMLHNAALRDSDGSRWQAAEEACFHWGIVSAPKHPRALLNYALLLMGVHKDYDGAERFFHRALAVAPYDPAIVKNFDDFQLQRLPGGAFAGGGPSSSVIKQSEVHTSKPEWGEWQRMKDSKARDAKFELYWLNTLSSVTKWEGPNFDDVWQVRLGRSELVQKLGEWDEMYDGRLGVTFYHKAGTFQCEDPFGG